MKIFKKGIEHIDWKSHGQNALYILSCTLIAAVISLLIKFDITSTSVFTPRNKMENFDVVDIAQSYIDEKKTQYADSIITIIDIDRCGRSEVIEIINKISECEPNAIGLDVTFKFPTPDSALLCETLGKTSNLVCAAHSEKCKNGYRQHKPTSFYENKVNVVYGYTNFEGRQPRDVIRNFRPYTLTSDMDTLWNFSPMLAKFANKEAFDKYISKHNRLEKIIFDVRKQGKATKIYFNHIDGSSILEDRYEANYIRGKVVLIGNLNNFSDTHATSIRTPMPGVLLHAYMLQMILSNNFTKSSRWADWLIAIFLCLIIVYLSYNVQRKWNRVANLILRGVPFLLIIFLILISFWFYGRYHIYIDCQLSIIMSALGMLFIDIAITIWPINKNNK